MANPPNPNPNPIHRLSHHLNAQPQYFVCRRCRTPVLHHSDCLGLLQDDVYGLLCDCDYPFNVRTHDAIHRFFYDLPINNVRCNHCSKLIGVKFIVAGDTDTDDRDPPYNCVLEGTVLFYSELMLYWDGSRHSLIDADLGEQITSLINFDGSRLTFYSHPFEETDEEDSE